MYYLRKRANKRREAISRQLSDVLDLLVVCVEAGLGLFEAIKVVGDETARQEQAIGYELTLVAGEVAAGASLGQGLRNLADRTAVEDLRPLAATLIQSEQLGGANWSCAAIQFGFTSHQAQAKSRGSCPEECCQDSFSAGPVHPARDAAGNNRASHNPGAPHIFILAVARADRQRRGFGRHRAAAYA